MSENLQPQPSDEVDLGQLFKALGNLFSRLFAYIGSILNSLFLAFVWLVFFVKKNIIKLVVASVIGFLLGLIKEATTDPIYSASLVVRQNYNTGENLNRIINRYNSLISSQDSMVLANNLKILPSDANMLSGFYLESILSDNQKLKSFDNYKKDLDSVIASEINFKTFLNNGNAYDDKLQRIIVHSKTRINFDGVLNQIVNNVESSGFFKNEQKKDLAELSRKEDVIIGALKESDSLQKVYQLVLEKSVESIAGSQTSVTIDNTEDKGVTKEFELYNRDLELKREVVSIKRQKENLEHIIEVISGNESEGVLVNGIDIFGKRISIIIYFGIAGLILTFLILIGFEFLKFLEQYKNKV